MYARTTVPPNLVQHTIDVLGFVKNGQSDKSAAGHYDFPNTRRLLMRHKHASVAF